METPTTTETPIATNGTGPERTEAEHRGLNELFRYNLYVHIGPGAEECEDRENGKCGDPTHFHAWLRLPNQFQAKNIRDKALAAKARKIRRLRDPESDAFAVLDSEMEELRRVSEPVDLIEELIQRNYWRDQMAAVASVMETDEFKTIRDDRERLRALEAKSEEDRSEEEFAELQTHVDSYFEAVDKRRAEEQQPQRDGLAEKPIEELVEMVREERIAAEATEDFISEFSLWQSYICTLRPVERGATPTRRVFESIDHLKNAAPEVIAVLETSFRELEASIGAGALGNS